LGKHKTWDFLQVLEHSLFFVCACYETRLIGFGNVAWDGAQHAFILDTTVHKDFRRRGVGIQLVKRAAEAAIYAGRTDFHTCPGGRCQGEKFFDVFGKLDFFATFQHSNGFG
jgi:GNAT superfamily N-acetyltransferase